MCGDLLSPKLMSSGIVVDDVVLHCTNFRKRHPGGASIIEGFAGKDCSWQIFETNAVNVLC